jgi:large subunit ribosomal protein L20
MRRVTRGLVAQRRRKKVLSLSIGVKGSNSRLYRVGQQKLMQSMSFSYADRKKRIPEHRCLWLIRINAGVRTINWSYSSFMYNLRQKKIRLSRKVLAQLILFDPIFFHLFTIIYDDI